MGTILAAIAIVLACVLSNIGFGSHWYVMGAMIVVLWAAAFLRSRADVMCGAALFSAFGMMMSAPFEAPRKFLNEFKRAARGDGPEAEAAKATLEFYEMLGTYAWHIESLLIAIIVAAVIVAAMRDEEGAHPFYLRGSDGLANFSVGLGKIASFLFLPMIALIIYDVAQRQYLTVDPEFTNTALYQTLTSTKLQEMQWHLHAILFLMCFGFAYVKDAHVRIELVRDQMGPRSRVWIELLGCVFFLVSYCFVVVNYGAEFARKSFDINEVSSALTGLPYRFIIKSFLPIGFMLLALAGLSVALKCIVYLFGPTYLREKAGYYAGTHHADIPEEVLKDRSE